MISTPCDIVYPIDSHSRPPNISSIRAERAHDSSTPRSNGCVAKHLSDWVRSPWETTTLSIVFDARKNAEQSKRAREAIAGTPQLPELAPHSSDPRDTAPANAWAPSVDIAKGTIPQQAPIVRSLLRMPRSERRATTPHTSNVVREASRIEPTTLILREESNLSGNRKTTTYFGKRRSAFPYQSGGQSVRREIGEGITDPGPSGR